MTRSRISSRITRSHITRLSVNLTLPLFLSGCLLHTSPHKLKDEQVELFDKIGVSVVIKKMSTDDGFDSTARRHFKTLKPKGWKNLDTWVVDYLQERDYQVKLLRPPIDFEQYGCEKELKLTSDAYPKLVCKKNLRKALKLDQYLRITVQPKMKIGQRAQVYSECKMAFELYTFRTNERLWNKGKFKQLNVDNKNNWENPPHYPDVTLTHYKNMRDCADYVKKIVRKEFK